MGLRGVSFRIVRLPDVSNLQCKLAQLPACHLHLFICIFIFIFLNILKPRRILILQFIFAIIIFGFKMFQKTLLEV